MRVTVDRVGAGNEARDFVLAERDRGQHGTGLRLGYLVAGGGRFRLRQTGRANEAGESARALEKVAALQTVIVERVALDHAIDAGAVVVVHGQRCITRTAAAHPPRHALKRAGR